MKSSSKRILSILTAILMIIASLFVYSSLIRPAYSEIKKLRGEVAVRLDLADRYKNSIEQVKKILGEFQKVGQLQETVSAILPTEQDLPLAAHQIVSLADVSKLPIELLAAQQLAIKPSVQPPLVKGIGTLRFNIKAGGSYEQFKFFLQNLETNINLMNLTSLKMETEGGVRGANRFSYTMVVDVFYQSE